MIVRLLFVLVSLASYLPAVRAAQSDAHNFLNVKQKSEFQQQAQKVRSGMDAGGRFEFVDAAERATVERRLAQMQQLFDSYADNGRLPDAKLMEMLSAQEQVNGILTRKDGNRLVCSRITPTGSHRPVNNCKPFAQIERARRDTQASLHSQNPRQDERQKCMNMACTRQVMAGGRQ